MKATAAKSPVIHSSLNTMNVAKKSLKSAFDVLGLEVRKKNSEQQVTFPVELSDAEKDIFMHVRGQNLSMTSDERLFTTMMACKHAVTREIEGDFVECGVWRGGNSLLAAAIFTLYKSPKKVFLLDTFEGMTEPTEHDKQAASGQSAKQQYMDSQKDSHNEWCFASLRDVKSNFERAGLLSDNVIFIKGDVLETLEVESQLPTKISVLRLDTDWYASTRKELEVLYPRLSIGGSIIIDDYGHWAGAKQATDEYFEKMGHRPFLQYTDYTGRVGVRFD